MRRILFFLIILIFLVIIPAAAADVILGTVVSLDRDTGKMTVRLSGGFNGDNAPGDNAGTEIIAVKFTAGQLEKSIKEGQLIRLWGRFDSGAQNVFQATEIERSDRQNRFDPTGVRGRLGKRRGMGGGHHGGKGRGGN